MASSKSKKYKVAIIGAGWSGLGSQLDELRIKPASHAEAATMTRGAKLSALADVDPTVLKVARRLYPKVLRFSDTQVMLEKTAPDIVIIATHPDTHCQYIELASKNKVKAILCEKPISHNLKQAKKAVAVAKKNKVLLFINHNRRFDPLIRRFREYVKGSYVRDTFLGKVKSATAFYNKGIYHGGTHYIDLLRFYLGEVKWVSALAREGVTAAKGDLAVDCLLGFEAGVVASLQYFDSSAYVLAEVSFFGEGGRLDLKHNAGLIIESIGTHSYKDISGYRELDYENKKTYGKPRSLFAPQIPHIIDCLEGRDEPVSTGDDAIEALRVIKAIEKSAKQNGKKIKV